MTTRLVKIGEAAYDTYIGRGSPFGNPFVIGASTATATRSSPAMRHGFAANLRC